MSRDTTPAAAAMQSALYLAVFRLLVGDALFRRAWLKAARLDP